MPISTRQLQLAITQIITRIGLTAMSQLTDKIDAFLAKHDAVVNDLRAALAASQADDAADEATIKSLQDEVQTALDKLDAASSALGGNTPQTGDQADETGTETGDETGTGDQTGDTTTDTPTDPAAGDTLGQDQPQV